MIFKERNFGTRGYTGYRGRRGGEWKKWVVLLLVLVILAGATFLFAQRYRVYHSDGTSRIELPWGREKSAEAPPSDAQEGG
jgi:hypothetical protein